MRCQACGEDNPAGNRFCEACGQPLNRICDACGHGNRPEARFCGDCGASLEPAAEDAAPTGSGEQAAAVPLAERRLVSVVFADLVGFTTIAEDRDPEEVREILSAYFERMREVVARHGGTIEKFIGDAVMAVWGTPVAHEDDAERAVRAALSMTAAVAGLRHDLMLPGEALDLRVGVLTGEAAITVGAEGQGMVAGDLVNTASRVQSVAAPGTVLVDEATRRASEAAVAFEHAGDRELKGKSAPVPVWRAVRVVSGRGGAGRALGLEAPFVGRDEELGLLIDLFHAVSREGRARLVSVGGVAGVGKSRLAWEFEKYIDGVTETVLWHRGRCVAYGEGVTYWAMAEMVRMRARLSEDEDPATARAKLRETVERYVPDAEERDWVEGPLAHLLGLETAGNVERQELFAAWRLFFERLSDAGTVALVFEDMQWADAALLDFVEYLLDWSRGRPLFVLTLARPELLERRPGWGAGTRAFTSLFLEPLTFEAMDKLVRGLVPGLPEELLERIRDRAEGIPLYAVEIIRMLLDRGLIVREAEHFVLTGDVSDLEVPETLRSLIAARLDGLPPDERGLLRDASVLGKTFSTKGLAAVGALSEPELVELLGSLTHKELLFVQTDPLSPERGQYGFLQDLVRDVAYQTLSRKERKARHLGVARFLERSLAADEGLVQIVAAHYLQAYRLLPDAPDRPEIRRLAEDAMRRSGERAASLGAPEEARRYFERALELTDDPEETAVLTLRAGLAAADAVQPDDAVTLLARAAGLLRDAGRVKEAATASVQLVNQLWNQDRIDDAIAQLTPVYEALSAGEPDEALAKVAVELGRLLHFRGDQPLARERTDEALRIADALDLAEVSADALITMDLIESAIGPGSSSYERLLRAVDIAERHQLQIVLLRALNNLSVGYWMRDRFEDNRSVSERGLALARRLGLRFWEWQFLNQWAIGGCELGEWDQALDLVAMIPNPAEVSGALWPYLWGGMGAIPIHLARGDIERAQTRLEVVEPHVGASRDVQTRGGVELMRAWMLGARGEHEEAMARAETSLRLGQSTWADSSLVGRALVQFSESGLAIGDGARVRALVDEVAVAADVVGPEPLPSLVGHVARFRARLAVLDGRTDDAETGFSTASRAFRALRAPFRLAVVELEHAEWLASEGRADRAVELLADAEAIFDRLEARPWLERARLAARS